MDKEMLSQVRMIADRIEVPMREQCGPRMQALTDNQRRYVCALGVFGNHQTLAYQWAFGVEKEGSAKASASRLGSQDKIKKAIQEHYSDKINTLGPALAAERILEALGPTNTDLKLALKAAALAADIVPGFKAATEHHVTVEHQYTLADLEKRRAQLERELGIAALPAPAEVVEAEYEEVVEETGLEDLL